MKIQLNGYILVPDDRLDAVRAGLIDHIRLTHQEPGCISFEVTENPDVPGRFDVAEVFTDQASFDAHQARTKASVWADITAGIPRDYEITEVSD
ncbi:putative quinol monooxygenase [Halocynthiibacter sp.]|uniref:putative quinol monooxygenase n=1 Tax=Halocynthiibacter sp. TaxID=1979210 RepID=UPI003C4BD3C8